MMEAPITLEDASDLKGVRVLVVEDDGLLLMALETVLLEAGAEIAGLCRSVAEALRVVENGGVHVAILDFRLGKETAVPIAKRLKADGTPFCFYTGQVAADSRFADWQDCAFLHKPAQPRAIVAKMAALAADRAKSSVP